MAGHAVENAIDWNRGVTSRQHKKSGIWVNMYKDSPGVFYDMRGGVVPSSIAKDCGFDIAKLKRAAQRKNEIDKVMKEMDEKYSGSSDQEVIFERGDYKVVAASKGFADIYDVDGNHWNTVQMKSKEAIEIVKKLTYEEEGAEQTA